MYSQSCADHAYSYYHMIILNPISIDTWVWSHVQSMFPHSYNRIYGPCKNDDGPTYNFDALPYYIQHFLCIKEKCIHVIFPILDGTKNWGMVLWSTKKERKIY